MENKINLVELLKDCPIGMELDCTIFNEVVKFDGIDEDSSLYPIRVKIKDNTEWFDKYGCFSSRTYAKCVIFPKGKTTWEGFQRPFKDGDIVSTINGIWIGIVKKPVNHACETYITINGESLMYDSPIFFFERFATEKEKEKLFRVIKANGYKWNSETRTLEKIQPKFKVGDRIIKKNSVCVPILITNVSDEFYYSNTESFIGVLSISEQDEYVLLPNKFDINTLVPFGSRVLVRDNDYDEWRGAFWGHLRQNADIKYDTLRGVYRQCIPYNDDTKHLLGKTNSCDDYYKTWEK